MSFFISASLIVGLLSSVPLFIDSVLLYVDDIIITDNYLSGIDSLKRDLNQHFEMKDLGLLSYFLGLEVNSTDTGYYFSQTKYATDLISKAGLTDSKIESTPLDSDVKLMTSDGQPLSNPTLYRQLMGGFIYLTISHSDIAYAIHLIISL